MQDLDVYKLQLIIWPNRDDRLLELYTNYIIPVELHELWGKFQGYGMVNMIWKQQLGSHSYKETRKNSAHRQVWCFWRLKDNPFCNLHIPPPQSLALGSWQCRYNFAVEIASFGGERACKVANFVALSNFQWCSSFQTYKLSLWGSSTHMKDFVQMDFFRAGHAEKPFISDFDLICKWMQMNIWFILSRDFCPYGHVSHRRIAAAVA